MRVLAVETSTLAGGAAILDGDRVVGQYLLDVSVTHSERLMVAIDRLLGDAGWTPRDLDGLAVAIGPGSFTGLRIGLSTVKGLALALSIPVAGVPTLDAMAATVPFAALPVCPVLDARKREVYASLYRWDGQTMCREWDYLALAPDELARRLAEPVILLGDAARAIRTEHARLAPPTHRAPSPACVGLLGSARLRAGETVAPAALVPIYLRPSEAELKRRAVAVR
ncbi:MAG: tRNA (adenosine(37)-N6)-threonylcarbamoyltransferase complex dimerization subunit type 1 TsaB [Candidatus Rokubacteria bacterium]|nr:tRNA (adenosine(37)-N6)-threonylcarbamoyltransferase complex dimerization subunit type 1 TsaB [Candidatus Rokubacteria bacterium]